MSKINFGRVLLGGIVAGLVIDISEFILNTAVVGADMNAALTRMNLPPIGNQAAAIFVVLGFIVGILAIWLYAAIRARYGPGPKTALRSGATVWFFAYLYSGIGMMCMGMFPVRVMVIGLVWGLVEILVASEVGAYLYKE